MSRGVNRSDSTSAFKLGCEVKPAIEATAPSATSRPTWAPRSTLAACAPPMSCVWKWIGTPTSSRRALISRSAAIGLHRPAMSLMAIRFAPRFSSSLARLDVIREVVLGAFRVQDIAGVADARLAECPGLADGLERQLHVGDPVERVEHAEQVDSGGGGLGDERLDDVVGIARIADGVGPAKQHLEEDVGDFLAKLGQSLPWVFLEEPHGRVEGGAAPHLDREDARAEPGVGVGDAEHVAGSHAGRQQRLVGVAEGGVGHEQRLLARAPSAKRRRAPSPATAGASRAAARTSESNRGGSGSAAAACPAGRATPGKPLTVISAA